MVPQACPRKLSEARVGFLRVVEAGERLKEAEGERRSKGAVEEEAKIMHRFYPRSSC